MHLRGQGPERRLVFAGDGGRLYYETRLVYAPRDPVARDEGFTISRTLEWLDGAGKSGAVEAGATLRVNLTVVTPVVRHNVAVVDRIPAGFEALDASLATASRAPGGGEAEALGYLGYGEETVEDRMDELPEFGGSWVFDHHEIDDAEVRLYAGYMPPGVHTYRYVVRLRPGDTPPAATVRMYERDVGRNEGGRRRGGDAEVAEIAEAGGSGGRGRMCGRLIQHGHGAYGVARKRRQRGAEHRGEPLFFRKVRSVR